MLENGVFINNRYEIVSRVGAGGMSDVYKAKDHKLNRNVAIKVLKKEFSNDRNFVSKFRVEAQSAASLIHPNIVNIYDVGEDNGLYYIVMELIEGITLKHYIGKKGSLSYKETISIAIQIANGIECAHNNMIIHRDIKPQNIMISREGKVKVTDFGIARAASANTMSGTAMGSVHYISPEQAGGKYVDERSDIYSLGITMFEMITGKVPFDGESTVTIALKHIQNTVPRVSEYVDNVPISVDKIISKATNNKAELRYPRISLLIADMKRALVEPDVDFVKIDDGYDRTSTIMFTGNDVKAIREASEETGNSAPKGQDDQDDIDYVSPKNKKRMKYGAIASGIAALMIIGVILTVVYVNSITALPSSSSDIEEETIPADQTEVPNVVGLSLDEAESALNSCSLGFIYDSEYVYSDIYAADTVVSQSEEAGTIIDKNSTITLVASLGPEKIQVPEIEGETLDDAEAQLTELGLDWEVTYEYNSKDINTVISCDPNENSTVEKGTVVSLVVSRGTESSGEISVYTVPNVVGKKESKADAAISSAGFDVGTVTKEYSDTVAAGKVIRQTVRAGTTAPAGTEIGLIISLGSETETTTSIYTASYTFALEDLRDSDGNSITSGYVTVYVDSVQQEVDSSYTYVESWTSDYTMTFTSGTKGQATLELLVDGVIVVTDTVNFK